MELFLADLGDWEQLELCAPLLEILVQADAPAQQLGRRERREAPAHSTVVVVAIGEAIAAQLPRGVKRRNARDELAHAGRDRAAVPAAGGEAVQVGELSPAALERAQVIQARLVKLADRDLDRAHARQEREQLDGAGRRRQRRWLYRRAGSMAARAAQAPT